MLDRAALSAYRRRLAELDEELDDARAAADLARAERATDEREQLLAELRRSTRPGGTARTSAPRLRSGRARRSVRGSATRSTGSRRCSRARRHLDRSVSTGHACRYEPREG